MSPVRYMLSYNMLRDYDDRMSTLSTGFAPGSETAAAEPFEAVVPRRRGRGLAHALVDDLGDKIRNQQLRPGDKLPTESAIMQVYGGDDDHVICPLIHQLLNKVLYMRMKTLPPATFTL